MPTVDACSAISGGGIGPAITNGATCSTSSTSVVLLNVRDSTGPSGQCSGTIISPRAVLTAAHCLGADATEVRVWLGSGDQVTASSFQAHPRYSDRGGAAFDVAVVLMPQDLGRTPIPLLFSRDARVGEPAVVGGWGKDQDGGVPLLRAGANTISALNSLYLETQYSSSTSSVCYGDSGGPLLVSEGGRWGIAGVISQSSASGYNCANSTSYFASVRNADVRNFILGLEPDAAQR